MSKSYAAAATCGFVHPEMESAIAIQDKAAEGTYIHAICCTDHSSLWEYCPTLVMSVFGTSEYGFTTLQSRSYTWVYLGLCPRKVCWCPGENTVES